jgi:hypothetical protein
MANYVTDAATDIPKTIPGRLSAICMSKAEQSVAVGHMLYGNASVYLKASAAWEVHTKQVIA